MNSTAGAPSVSSSGNRLDDALAILVVREPVLEDLAVQERPDVEDVDLTSLRRRVIERSRSEAARRSLNVTCTLAKLQSDLLDQPLMLTQLLFNKGQSKSGHRHPRPLTP
jgi:hypothetical protein